MHRNARRVAVPSRCALAWSLAATLAALHACSTPREAVGPVAPRLPLVIQADTTPFRFSIPRRPGQISPDSQARLGSVVAALRAEPGALTIRVGDTVSVYARVRIIAFDSAGRALGEIHGYDFRPRGSVRLLRDGRLLAPYLGTGEFHVTFPRRLWKGAAGESPSVVIPLHLTATGPTSPPIMVNEP